MSSSCEKTNTISLGCHPYITIACIISCAICTIVMIWGTFAMRADMQRMEQMMSGWNMMMPSSSSMHHDMDMK